MFDYVGFARTVAELVIGIALIVVHLRLTGKQQTIAMTPIDFIGNFILGGIIGGVIYNHSISFFEYIAILVVTLLIISGLNILVSRFMSTRSLVMGRAYTIVEDGRFTAEALGTSEHQLDPVEFLAELRGMGIYSLSEVAFAQREANGSLTVLRPGEGRPNYLLVSNGAIVPENLEIAGRSEEWLRAELSEAGAPAPEEVYVVELDGDQRLNVVDRDGHTTSFEVSDPLVEEVVTVTEFEDPGLHFPALKDFVPSDALSDGQRAGVATDT